MMKDSLDDLLKKLLAIITATSTEDTIWKDLGYPSCPIRKENIVIRLFKALLRRANFSVLLRRERVEMFFLREITIIAMYDVIRWLKSRIVDDGIFMTLVGALVYKIAEMSTGPNVKENSPFFFKEKKEAIKYYVDGLNIYSHGDALIDSTIRLVSFNKIVPLTRSERKGFTNFCKRRLPLISLTEEDRKQGYIIDLKYLDKLFDINDDNKMSRYWILSCTPLKTNATAKDLLDIVKSLSEELTKR